MEVFWYGCDKVRRIEKRIGTSRTTLAKYCYVFDGVAKASIDDKALKSIALMLGDSFRITGRAFTEIENLYLANATLKNQVEILKDILLSVPGIRDNPQFREEIQKQFDAHQRYGIRV